MNLPWGVEEPRNSWFGQTSAAIAPVFAPAGLDSWEVGGALLTGFIAKEVVVSTMTQIYVGEADNSEEEVESTFGQDLGQIIGGFALATVDAGKQLLSLVPGINLVADADEEDTLALSLALSNRFTPLAALAFLVFVLVYTPCVATLGAIGRNTAGNGSGYPLVINWPLPGCYPWLSIRVVASWGGANAARNPYRVCARGYPALRARSESRTGSRCRRSGGYARHFGARRASCRSPNHGRLLHLSGARRMRYHAVGRRATLSPATRRASGAQ
jgi:hypothetical protein